MKKLFLSVVLSIIFCNMVSAKTLIVPIDGEINNAKSNFVKENIKDLTKEDTVLFRINTLGGRIDSAEEMKNSIVNTPAKTISVVDNKAESAGVLITIAADKIYMTKGSTIGSAEPIPNTEKILSYWRSILEDTANMKGRNPKIIMGMADSSIKIDGVVDEGKLLNLNAEKSKNLGISDMTVDKFDDVLKIENISKISMAQMSPGDKFLDFISSQSISSLLLIVGMAAMVIELFMPGFGVGGVISIISFGLFFTGNIVAGHASWYAIAIFILGLILIVVEIMMPGFGIAGISGIIAIAAGIIFAMQSIEIAVKSLSIAIIITICLVIFMIKKGMKTSLFSRLVLKNSLKSEYGFVSVDTAELKVGDVCISKTVMKPTGYILFNDKQYEAISVDGYIEKNVEVEVCTVEKSKIFIRRTK